MIDYGYVNVSDFFRITTLYTAFEDIFAPDYYFNGEHHNFWELVLVIDGELGVTAGSDALLLHKGQAILHEPMKFHRLWSEGDSYPHIVIFSFSAENMPKQKNKIFEITDSQIPIDLLSKIQNTFETSGMNIIGKGKKIVDCIIAVKKLEEFILSLLSQRTNELPTVESRTARNYAMIVKVLENNIDQNLSVSDISKICNMSETNVKKTFSRYAGMGIMHYFNYIKMNAAISMLENGMSVNETAQHLGFSNQNYFSTAFKRVYGMSPLYYLKHIHENKIPD